jgi:hypothetical protein
MKYLFYSFLLLTTFSCNSGKGLFFTTVPAGTALVNDSANLLNHSAWDAQLKKYVAQDGLVNYNDWLQEHNTLKAYLTYLNNNAPQKTWSQAAQFAYYINLYNAATVNMILANGIPESIKDIDGPLGQVWSKDAAQVSGKWYSLKAIEDGVLRNMGDARIHFAINCASYSCPQLLPQAYTATNANSLMETSARTFINSTKNDLSGSNPRLSKIFDWYSADFTATGLSIVDYVNQYATKPIDVNASFSYLDYDWALNKQ